MLLKLYYGRNHQVMFLPRIYPNNSPYYAEMIIVKNSRPTIEM